MENLERRYFENGKLMLECPLKDGIRDGVCKEYYESGALRRTSTYRDGLMEGPMDILHENGQRVCRHVYRKGCVVDGLVPVFYPDGTLCESEYWENGRCRSYNRNNHLCREFGLINTDYEGIFRRFYEDGRLAVERFYNAGRLDGFEKFWSKDGLLCDLSLYIDGEECGNKRMVYFESGMLSKEIDMNGDLPDGVEVCYNENGKISSRVIYEMGMVRDGENCVYDGDGKIEYRNYWRNNTCKTCTEQGEFIAFGSYYRDKSNGKFVLDSPDGENECYFFDGGECKSKEEFLEKTFEVIAGKLERSFSGERGFEAETFRDFLRGEYERIAEQGNLDEEYFDYEELVEHPEGIERSEWICRQAVREFMLRLRLPNDGPTEEGIVQNLIQLVG